MRVKLSEKDGHQIRMRDIVETLLRWEIKKGRVFLDIR